MRRHARRDGGSLPRSSRYDQLAGVLPAGHHRRTQRYSAHADTDRGERQRQLAAVANAAVEIWQCDASGNYSEYSQPGYNGTGQTFLRGLQTTDANGVATFKTIYPGWYAGRATHVHVQVSRNGGLVKTTQIAFPEDVSATVYQTGAYVSHGQNATRNSTDNVFSDGTQYEMATITGSAASGYTATLSIGIAG